MLISPAHSKANKNGRKEMRLRICSFSPNTDHLNAPTVLATFLISMFLALMTCGCTTVQTSDLPPDELQKQIAAGQLAEPGDHVTLTTTQGITYDLEITQVSKERIEGVEDIPENQRKMDENLDTSEQTTQRSVVEIPISEISNIQTREAISAGQAAGATGAVVAAGGIMFFAYVLLPVLLVGALAGL
jgi:hypothetical protein